MAVEAAEELVASSHGGRLSIPLLEVLDEAADACHWRGLPNLHSHYGSRRIMLVTILRELAPWSLGMPSAGGRVRSGQWPEPIRHTHMPCQM